MMQNWLNLLFGKSTEVMHAFSLVELTRPFINGMLNDIMNDVIYLVGMSSIYKSPAAPTISGITDVGSDRFTVNWDYTNPTTADFQQASEYRVTYSGGGASQTKPVANIDTKMLQITGLTSNTDYSVTVVAWKSDVIFTDDSASSPVTTFNRPTGLSATTVTSTSIEISWSAPHTTGGGSASIAGYVVSWTPASSGGSSTKDVTDTSTSIDNLQANTDYSITVAAKSTNGGAGALSDALPATTVPSKINQPSNSSDATTSKIYLSWDAVSGTSPSLMYAVSWTSSGSFGSRTGLTTTSATISGLTASTRYSFTVTTVNDGGSADPSDPAMFSTLPSHPGMPTFTQPSTNLTTQLNVEWNKPPGGDDIVDYVVDWWLSSSDGSMTSLGIVTGVTTSSYTIEGLTPGETYDVTVKARNSAGAGQSSTSARHTTNPDFIKNLSVEQNSTQPDKLLVLTWETPSGTGDNIMIQYWSLTEHTMNTTSVEFEISQTSLSVFPGNNYTVTVTVHSKGYESTPESIDTNSKPSEPSFVVDVFTNELQVNWTSPDGHYEGVAIYFNNTEIAARDSGSYTLKDLKPYTDYDVEMYSWITNVTGSVERSRLSSATYKTLPGAPPQPIFNSSLSDNAESSTNAITFVLPPNTFSEKNGPVEYYAVYLAFGDSPNPTPNVTNMRTCESLTSDGECVTLWTDGQGNLVQGNVPQKTKRNVMTRQTGSIEFIIGDGSVTLSPWNHTYVNYPLQPNTGYRVAVAANTGNEEMTATEFYPTITTGDSGTIYLPYLVDCATTGDRLLIRKKDYDVTRVKLEMIEDEPGTDFIHANYIPGYNEEKEFIASQGPLPTTKEDFWRMIWEQNSRTIVMLTQIVEGERVKCDHYWPYNNEPVVMAGIAVKLVVESTSRDWVCREFTLSKNSEQRLVTQFHYTAWPDHGVPETAENLVKFVTYFQKKVSRETRDCGPITVHCSAGVGRTGTFIAMDRLLQHMKDHDYVDIFGIVHQMRMCRVAMVQTDKQYILLHEMVQEVVNEVYDVTDEVAVYENTTQSPIYENIAFSGLHG
ncbi:uncharacterized protein LOC143448813 [Clavelina lepadiformis]|uniref:uncharacterized protein LOC143448813 n=1 Tax=Clavelina lepadiformis TaxID=159417 RepID=UPI0040418E30